MESNQKNVLVNRIVSFLVGGVLVFAVMSFTVVRNARSENVGLTSALDSSRYEAGRLLADAEAELDAREYEAARASLEALFANQPGSEESVQGRLLLVTVNDRERNADARWEDALPGIRESWSAEMAAELRAEADTVHADTLSGIDAKVLEAWSRAEDEVRSAFEDEA
jgi:hypothetical protein